MLYGNVKLQQTRLYIKTEVSNTKMSGTDNLENVARHGRKVMVALSNPIVARSIQHAEDDDGDTDEEAGYPQDWHDLVAHVTISMLQGSISQSHLNLAMRLLKGTLIRLYKTPSIVKLLESISPLRPPRNHKGSSGANQLHRKPSGSCAKSWSVPPLTAPSLTQSNFCQ
jgi:hypothetical protein